MSGCKGVYVCIFPDGNAAFSQKVYRKFSQYVPCFISIPQDKILDYDWPTPIQYLSIVWFRDSIVCLSDEKSVKRQGDF